MKDQIVFTHDVLGERDWVINQFPGYTNLETSSSGKWPTLFPKNNNQSGLYEIAYSDDHNVIDLLNSDISKTKSFYSNDPLLILKDNKYWVCSDNFISNVEYKEFVDRPLFWALNIARSGTVFTEILLQQFRQKYKRHVSVGSYKDIVDTWQQAKANPDIALVLIYSNDIWEVFVSNVLGWHYGFHHCDNFDWSLVKPVAISTDSMLQFQSMVIATLNSWCNLRSLLPTHSFILLDGKKIIQQYQHLVKHDRVAYNKKDLVTNYAEAKEKWFSEFNDNVSKMLSNSISHLTNMNCKQNLDHLL